MTDKTHQLIGLTAATSGFILNHPNIPITWAIAWTIIIGAFVGSLFPDIDQPTAPIWKSVPMGRVFNRVAGRLLGGHRNVSHSFLGIALFYLLMFWISKNIPEPWFLDPKIFLESAMIGFIFHLIFDAVTVLGIPLLWPWGDNMGFPPHPFHGVRVITGRWFENLVVFPGFAIILAIIIFANKTAFCPIIPSLCH